jgi:membrane-associated phospholipid phosphatase
MMVQPLDLSGADPDESTQVLILVATFSIAYGASLTALIGLGIRPVIPSVLLLLLPSSVPLAFGITATAGLLDRWLGQKTRSTAIVAVLTGVVLVGALRSGDPAVGVADVILFGILVAQVANGLHRNLLRPIALSLLVITVGFATIWNLNYLALRAVRDRLQDPIMRQLDLAVYRFLAGHAVEYAGLFPLVRSPLGFRVLENAYTMLFTEILVVIFAIAKQRARLVRHLGAMFGFYALGVVAFLVYPVVGPYLYYPQSFAQTYQSSMTYVFMHSSFLDFSAVRRLAPPLTGFGYFVGLPSLHAGLALLFQLTLWPSRTVFWLVLPINLLIVASTFLLGYHYVADTLAGLLMAPLIYWLLHVLPLDSARRAALQ